MSNESQRPSNAELSSPLLSVIPEVLGFHPVDSYLIVPLSGEYVGAGTTRDPLAPPEGPTPLALSPHGCCATDDPDQFGTCAKAAADALADSPFAFALIVATGDGEHLPDDHDASREIVAETSAYLERRGVSTAGMFLAAGTRSGDRWVSVDTSGLFSEEGTVPAVGSNTTDRDLLPDSRGFFSMTDSLDDAMNPGVLTEATVPTPGELADLLRSVRFTDGDAVAALATAVTHRDVLPVFATLSLTHHAERISQALVTACQHTTGDAHRRGLAALALVSWHYSESMVATTTARIHEELEDLAVTEYGPLDNCSQTMALWAGDPAACTVLARAGMAFLDQAGSSRLDVKARWIADNLPEFPVS